jgi:DNA-binding transcriptional regulator of glucitol operon
VYSRLLTPRWVLLHLLVAALFVATFFLGYWQLTKAEAGGGAVNWSYALQWPLYGFMGLWFYVRMVRIELHRDPDEDQPGNAVVLYQRPRIDTTGDPELARRAQRAGPRTAERRQWPLSGPRPPATRNRRSPRPCSATA